MYSLAGCPRYSLNQMFIFFDSIRLPIGIALIPPGIFLLIKGRSLIHVSIFVSNCICLLFAMMFITYHIFLSHNRIPWVGWVNLVVWTIMAGGLSHHLTKRKLKAAVFTQAAFAGFLVAMLLSTLSNIPYSYDLYILMALLGPANTYLLFKKPDSGMILNSSLLGSYFLIRGLTLIVGPDFIGMPNEFAIGNQLATGAESSVPWQYYPILASIITLCLCGSFFQYRSKKKESFDHVHLYHLV